MIDNPLRDFELKNNRGDNYQRLVQFSATLSERDIDYVAIVK